MVTSAAWLIAFGSVLPAYCALAAPRRSYHAKDCKRAGQSVAVLDSSSFRPANTPSLFSGPKISSPVPGSGDTLSRAPRPGLYP
jgi:hypothetical protein